jgi:hypothetical protein
MHIEDDAPNNYSIAACICFRGNVFTELFPSTERSDTEQLPCCRKDKHTDTQLMGGIYEIRRSDGLCCHDVYTKSHKDRFSHSKVDRGDIKTRWQHGNHISLL